MRGARSERFRDQGSLGIMSVVAVEGHGMVFHNLLPVGIEGEGVAAAMGNHRGGGGGVGRVRARQKTGTGAAGPRERRGNRRKGRG